MFPHVSVVIVAWNSGEDLRECVARLLSGTAPIVLEVVIVDNGSIDGSVQKVAAQFGDRLKIVRCATNLGFARACNLGARQSEADFYLFLNPDARIEARQIGEVTTVMRSRQFVGTVICGPRIVDEEGNTTPTCRRFPTPWNLLQVSMGLDRLFGTGSLPLAEHLMTHFTQQVIGAVFFVETRFFRSIGGFDERYFVYYEEVDLCFRAHAMGLKCLFMADVMVPHSGQGSSKAIRVWRQFYLIRSRCLFAEKHFSLFGAWLTIIGGIVIEPWVRTGYLLLERQFHAACEMLAVQRALLRWLFRSRVGKFSPENQRGI